MKQSIGYTLSLNIAITFIIIVFAFIAMALSYYRAFKVSKVITATIEKNEGYTLAAEEEILKNLSIIGYNTSSVSCQDDDRNSSNGITKNNCQLVENINGTKYSKGTKGYCVYYCDDGDGYYRYKTTTNMFLNIPIINGILNLPVEINTNKMYEYNITTRESFNDEEFNKDGTFTIPSSGVYRITASGAQGGSSEKYSPRGGKGAKVTANFTFNAGDILKIEVGMQGGKLGNLAEAPWPNITSFYYGDTHYTAKGYFYSGGGATKIYVNDNLIIVAAGGGGAVDYFKLIDGGNAGSDGTVGSENGTTTCYGNISGWDYSKMGGGGRPQGTSGQHCNVTVGSGGGGTSYVDNSSESYTIEDQNNSPNTGNGRVTIEKV